jgi:hypothetical protein
LVIEISAELEGEVFWLNVAAFGVDVENLRVGRNMVRSNIRDRKILFLSREDGSLS